MALIGFHIVQRQPYQGGRVFGNVGAYERIDALARYAVDPDHPMNAGVVDLSLAPRAADGRVHFSGDVSLLLPEDHGRANGALLLEAPNRGKRTALRAFNRAPADAASMARLDPGDGFLLARGWCIAWPGWQWDVPRGNGRLGLAAPEVAPERVDERAAMQLRFQLDTDRPMVALTDQHVGPMGGHQPIEPANVDDPRARLLVRDDLHETPSLVARDRWRFSGDGRGHGAATHVTLDGGFRAGRIYDLVYRPACCPVVGAGLLAVRDFAAWLRRNPGAPCAGAVRGIVGEGQSQCGRLLRTLLHLGLHLDESGDPVFDGVLIHVAGGRLGEFNLRYGQPSVQPTPGIGHCFPYADEPQADPDSGAVAGLLDTARARGGLPKIVYTDTASEYWRGDAGLTHVRAGDGEDLPVSADVRRYLFAGAQHGPGGPPLTHATRFGGFSANPGNLLDYRPLMRAALENLRAWILDGVAPPPSQVPRRGDGTAAERDSVLAALGRIPGFALPEPAALPAMRALALGADPAHGLGLLPPHASGDARPSPVSAVDGDGNEIAGIPMPDVTVPVATHAGFNPRHPRTGAPVQILEYIGSSVPLPLDDAHAAAIGDPRTSIASRYRNRDDYLARVQTAAHALVVARLLLAEDVETCVEIAAVRFDAVLRHGAQPCGTAPPSPEDIPPA